MIHLSDEDRKRAKGTALKIITDSANRVLSERTSTRGEKEKALSAMMSIEWVPDLAKMAGRRSICRLLQQTRNGFFTKEEYKPFRGTIVHATDETAPIQHGNWRIWHMLIIRYHLFELADTRQWMTLVARLGSMNIHIPDTLGRIPFYEISTIDWQRESSDMILLLWQAAKQDISGFADTKVGQAPPAIREFRNLIYSIRTEKIEDTDICRKFDELGKDFGPPSNFEAFSQAKKCSILGEADLYQGQIDEYLSLAARRNTVRAFAGSLRPAASGMQSYLDFFRFHRRSPFPAQTDTVLKWSGLFRPARTFKQYLAHVTKACILLHQPTGWLTPAIKSVARGLAAAQDVSFQFQNYIFAEDLLKLIKTVKLDNDFGMVCFFAFLPLLRIPSEALLMRRAGDSDSITDFPPQKHKILAGIRAVKGTPLFVAKFAWRNNMRRGCILRRPCLCGEKESLARALCPIHQVWHRMAQRTRPHELLFPPIGYAFSKLLRTNSAKAGFRSAGKFPSHCFRRGATQELQVSGGSSGTIKGAGCWRGMGFRSYVDTQLTDALKVSRILARATNSDSEDDADIPTSFARGDPLRKKLKVSPGKEVRIEPSQNIDGGCPGAAGVQYPGWIPFADSRKARIRPGGCPGSNNPRITLIV